MELGDWPRGPPLSGREGRGGRRKRSMAAAAGAGAGARLWAAAVLLLAGAGPVPAELTDGNSEHLKREHSLMKPYQGERGPGWRTGTGTGGAGPGARC